VYQRRRTLRNGRAALRHFSDRSFHFCLSVERRL
jgi:hypothetical protein